MSRRICDYLNTTANAYVGTYLIRDQQQNRDPELEYKLLITNMHILINAPSSGTLAALPGNCGAPNISVPLLDAEVENRMMAIYPLTTQAE